MSNIKSTTTSKLTRENFDSSFPIFGWKGIDFSLATNIQLIGTYQLGSSRKDLYKITIPLKEEPTAIAITKSGYVYGKSFSWAVINKIVTDNDLLIGQSITNGTAPIKLRLIGFIRNNYGNSEYFYPIYEEIDQAIYDIVWKQPTGVPLSLEPYQNITQTFEVTAEVYKAIYNSSSKGYGTLDNSKTQKLSVSINKHFTNSGSQELAKVTYPTNGENFYKDTYTWKIVVANWANDKLFIRENPTDYKVYQMKEIDQSFLNHFKITREVWNTYHPEHVVTDIQSSLDSSKVSKLFYEANEYVSFTYKYSNQVIAFEDRNKKVINFASKPLLFSNVTYKSHYKIGETFRTSDINVYEAGSLTYEDNSTIPLKNLMLQPSVTCSLGDEFLITNETPKTFNVTYHFNSLITHIEDFTYQAKVSEVAITRVELKGAKENFNVNEILEYGSSAYIECYNSNGALIETIPFANFQGNITQNPTNYGQVIGKEFEKDQVFTLKGKFRDYLDLEWNVYISYSEETLRLDTGNVKKNYYINTESEFNLDYTNLGITEIRHVNSKNQLGATISLPVNKVSCYIYVEPFTLLDKKVLPVNVIYQNVLKQDLRATYEINVYKRKPISIEVLGGSDTTKYWDNGKDKFHLPTGLTFKRKFNDNSKVDISDLSTLHYYKDSNCNFELIVGQSEIDKLETNTIYVKDLENNIVGSYRIDFKEDTISDVYLDSPISIVLGNKLEKFRSLFKIKAKYASGSIKEFNDYTFLNNEIYLSNQPIQVIASGKTYTLDNAKITFTNPSVERVDLLLNNMQTSFNNLNDAIDCSSLKMEIIYKDASFVQVCSLGIKDNAHFEVSCDNPQMVGYKYDGSQNLNITMTDTTIVNLTLKVSTLNYFDKTNIERNLNVSVLEIVNVVGLSLVKAYKDYVVGDTFLNENDDTEINVYYKDTKNIQRRTKVSLRNGLASLNIYPTKGTEFSNVGTKTIKITSATDYNVKLEYNVNVTAKYLTDKTTTHEIVAIFTLGYKLPNNKGEFNGYILIDSLTTYGRPSTILKNGERVLREGVELDTEVKVYGYLEDCFDTSKNARVILFNDYVSPINGSNNIEVTYPCYIPKNADKINKCKFGILFGNNNAKNRLFISGNEDLPNCDWHSGMIDNTNMDDETMINGNFGYFEDTSYCFYGETDNKVVGYDIVSNDKLLVLKNHSDKETTVYFRSPILVSAIDGAGTSLTGIDNQTLYQEEFSLVKGNNSVAGISPKSIINFNGDTLFVSEDNNILGLDLQGIIGDNQRYANTRSYYIDQDLKDKDLSKSWLWTDNKYLLFCLNEKTYLTHYETRSNETRQYEWFVLDTKDIQSVLKVEDTLYYGNSNGEFYKQSNSYHDTKKIFIGQGGSVFASEAELENKVVVSQSVINQLDTTKTYYFSVVPSSKNNNLEDYMYYKLGSISNVKGNTFDFYVREDNYLELLCYRNGEIDFEEVKRITNMISTNKDVFINHLPNEGQIATSEGSELSKYYKRYRLRKMTLIDTVTQGEIYALFDCETNQRVNVTELYRGVLCYQLTDNYKITNIDKETSTFKLSLDNQEVDIVRYADQITTQAFKAEIKLFEAVEAYYITKPYVLGNLNYFKTIWQYTLTNDTNIPSEVELTYASNKIPYEKTKTLAKISVDSMSFEFGKLDFRKIDFDKNLTPRTYTNSRILPKQKFICFGFKNYNATNSVLSSMSIIYSIPHASYSGD